MATGPVISNDPIEVLTFDPTREEPFINKYWTGGLCGVFGFITVCLVNWSTRRPMLSGLQKHALCTVGGVYLGQVIDGYRTAYFAERDAVLRHYIQLHPEDFPIPERKKYSEVLEPWIPIR